MTYTAGPSVLLDWTTASRIADDLADLAHVLRHNQHHAAARDVRIRHNALMQVVDADGLLAVIGDLVNRMEPDDLDDLGEALTRMASTCSLSAEVRRRQTAEARAEARATVARPLLDPAASCGCEDGPDDLSAVHADGCDGLAEVAS